MTINQFKKMNSDEQRAVTSALRDLCRYYLDEMDEIVTCHFRGADSQGSGWPCYQRPVSAEINRQYDYINGTWLFLHRLKIQLENIESNTRYNEIYSKID